MTLQRLAWATACICLLGAAGWGLFASGFERGDRSAMACGAAAFGLSLAAGIGLVG